MFYFCLPFFLSLVGIERHLSVDCETVGCETGRRPLEPCTTPHSPFQFLCNATPFVELLGTFVWCATLCILGSLNRRLCHVHPLRTATCVSPFPRFHVSAHIWAERNRSTLCRLYDGPFCFIMSKVVCLFKWDWALKKEHAYLLKETDGCKAQALLLILRSSFFAPLVVSIHYFITCFSFKS